MSLKGAPQLRARLRAVRQVFKPLGRAWADETVRLAKARVPVRTGATQRSIRRRNASLRKASVVGSFVVNFIDAGTKAHDEVPKRAKAMRFQAGGKTVFAKKVHKRATAARPFKKQVARQALQTVDVAGAVIREWNRAA